MEIFSFLLYQTNIKILALTLEVRIFFFINILTIKSPTLFTHPHQNHSEFNIYDFRLAFHNKKLAVLICR